MGAADREPAEYRGCPLTAVRVALVSSRAFPMPHWHDYDLPLLAAELAGRGATVEVVEWDGDTPVAWASYQAVVLQSPWSMWTDLTGFARWLRAREDDGTRLLNPVDTVLLGSDKRYLLRLGDQGVPIVPTTLVEESDAAYLKGLFPDLAGPRPTLVAKPIAAGGALGAREFTAAELPELIAHLRAAGPSIVQPYIAAIDIHRELGVVMVDGSISHAVTKAPLLVPGQPVRELHPDPQPYPGLTAQEGRVIHQTYAALRAMLTNEPLSVRLDFVVDPASPSGLLLLEAEMVAPVKFFPLFPAECANLAEAILARAAA
ncbi:RimK family alpha-L-glutamate ligase [Actinoplanes sp. NPDC051494]|uniref:RimK family alpha-L-glutamate ligase n=1 Tax=Actinoplanes sp. NPDC051494 TaxID=3363907 RepID=UPI00379A849B